MSGCLPHMTLIHTPAEESPGPLLLGQHFLQFAGGWHISANPGQLTIALKQTSGKPCALGLCREEIKMTALRKPRF